MRAHIAIKVADALLAVAISSGCFPLVGWAAVTPVADTNNAAQNRTAIQAVLDNGDIAELEGGEIYELDARLVITEPDSGIQSDDAEDPATIQFVPTEDNDVVAGARSNAYASVIFVDEVSNGPSEQVVIRDLIISRTHEDNTFVRTIDVFGSNRVHIENVEIENFSLGGMVTIASSTDVSVTHCHIHDCTASGGTQDMEPRNQVTAIEVDEERKFNMGVPIDSANLFLAHNRITNLEAEGDQSDGINIQGEGTGAQVINNYIDTVGEGIDLFCDQASIKHNIVRNGALFGIKLIHGASENMLENNLITTEDEGTLANVVVSGTGGMGLGDTFGNFFSHSTLDGALGFSVEHSETQTVGSPRYNFFFVNSISAPDIDPAHIQIIDSEYNKFLNSGLAAESEEGPNLEGNLILSDLKFVRTGDFDGQLGLDLFAYKNDGTNVQYFRRAAQGEFDQASNNITQGDIDNADNFLVGRFDDNASDDLVFHWKSSGENRFYLSNANSTYYDAGELIADTAINGNPDTMLLGDFNGDGFADLFFHWKGDGTNRLFINNELGTPPFNGHGNPIATTAINGNPDQVAFGDFNGDGRTDLYFYWKSAGTNRLYLKTGDDYSFTQYLNPNGTSDLSGGTEDMVIDDLNNDGNDDVLVYFPTPEGEEFKRVFFSNGDGTFEMREYDAH